MIKSRTLLLAGVSALAMLVCAAEANADAFTSPGKFFFTVPTSGDYSLEAFGASGGDGHMGAGGLGAELTGDIFLTAGEDLTLFVGGRGQSSGVGGGGGGSFVFLGTSLLAVAGGGGGGGFSVDGGFGRSGTSGGAGGGTDGGAGGMNGSGGGGGGYSGGGGGGGYGGGGGGGGSFAAISFSGFAIYGGVNSGNGSITITPLSGSPSQNPRPGE